MSYTLKRREVFHSRPIVLSYCVAPFILADFAEKIGHLESAYGWDADIYIMTGVVTRKGTTFKTSYTFCTGYRPTGVRYPHLEEVLQDLDRRYFKGEKLTREELFKIIDEELEKAFSIRCIKYAPYNER